MNTKKILIALSIISLLYLPFLISCSSDDATDPTKQDVLVGVWALEELLVDNAPFLGSIADYRLELKSDMSYSLAQVDKVVTTGTWSLISNDLILVLGAEELSISSLTVGKTTLVGTQASTKTGSSELIYKLIIVN